MRILDRFVLGTFTKLFVLSILATPPLFILGNLTEELDRYLDNPDIGWVQVVEGYLYQVPQYVVWSFPIAGLIATVFTVHGMTTHREIVAAKAGGISFYRIVTPVLLAGVLLTGAALFLTELAPRANRISYSILENRDRGRTLRSNFVYHTESGLILQARQLEMDGGEMEGLMLMRTPREDAPTTWTEANRAEWDSVAGWTFWDGYVRRMHEGEGWRETTHFERMRVPGLVESPDDLMQEPPEEEEMTYAEIERLASAMERSGGTPYELRVKQEQKIAIPLATFIIILFGAPLATSSRRGGAAYGIGVALGTTILYMALLRVSQGFGYSGAIEPLYAAWLPNALFLVAGVILMARVRT